MRSVFEKLAKRFELRFVTSTRRTPLTRLADLLALITIALFSSLLLFPSLRILEFFRHTEADRALISWQMIERQDFLIPHILDSPILTKPPLFYWLMAYSFNHFGGPSEWAARLPSAICGLILLLSHYIFMRRAHASIGLALTSSLMLSTGILFLNLAGSAEIDLLYGTLTTLALWSVFFAVTTSSVPWTITSYVFLGLALLAKGPPAVIFFAISLILFTLWRHYRMRSNSELHHARTPLNDHRSETFPNASPSQSDDATDLTPMERLATEPLATKRLAMDRRAPARPSTPLTEDDISNSAPISTDDTTSTDTAIPETPTPSPPPSPLSREERRSLARRTRLIKTHDFTNDQPFAQNRLIRAHGIGLCIALALVFCWLFPVSQRVGWQAIIDQFRVEIFGRFFYASTHKRGAFFYPLQILASLGPWAIILILGLIAPLRYHARASYSWYRKHPDYWDLFIYTSLVVGGGIFFLSLSEGKSSRYLFPLYPFAMTLASLSLFQLYRSGIPSWCYKVGVVFGAIGATVALSAPIAFRNHPGLTTLYLPCALLVLSSTTLIYGANKRNGFTVLAGIIFMMFSLRSGEGLAFAPFRNSTHSVKSQAEQIDQVVPANTPIYTVEIFERWTVYYLKLRGRTVRRWTPDVTTTTPRAYLLLSHDDEGWRVGQITAHDPSAKIVGDFPHRTGRLMVVECDSASLPYLFPQELIPTVPSAPYYAAVELTSAK